MKKIFYLFFIIVCFFSEVYKSLAQPPNDDPCSAEYLTIGVSTPGYTNGSSYISEPAVPSCFDAPPYNTVWYTFDAPPSGCASILTTTGTIADTQIGVYQGACGSLTLRPPPNCNDDVSGCSGYNYHFSFLQLSGLTPGASYYIMVDGKTVLTGNFSILVEDACTGTNLPPVPGKDCLEPIPVCSFTIPFANPGPQEYGNICDFDPSVSCLLQGEKESVWYLINASGAGNLEFSIVPNDWTSGCMGGTESDYDFAIWKIAGSGATATCANLGTPARCNYNTLGLTGCYQLGGGSPAAYGGVCWDNAYEPAISTASGDKYLLVISNWDNTNSGFTLYIQPTSPIFASVPPGGVVVWTGTTNTSWNTVSNWGGCQIPDCSHSALIPSSPVNQPVISLSGYSVRDLYINAGATLTLNAGVQLMVCGDFNNLGNFNALSSSTVVFEDTAVTPPLTKFHNQTIAANNVTPNDFWNVTVKKPPGYYVAASADLDMTGNFLVTGGTYGGGFDATSVNHKIGGNFTIDVTLPNIATYDNGLSLQFVGTAQTYLNRGILNNVIMNQTGAGTLTLQNHGAANSWMTLSNIATLTLNYGKIITGTSRVEVLNRAFNAITPGNINSYIQGNAGLLNSCLRKYLDQSGSAIGTYEFPIGTSTKGYQRLGLDFTSPLPSGVNYFDVSFNENVPANNTSLGPECTIDYHVSPASPLNNGYWQLQPNPASQFSSGMYTPHLYNLNYTNDMMGWTAMVNKINAGVASNWFLEPAAGVLNCLNVLCPVTNVKREDQRVAFTMQNTSVLYLGTAQSLDPLPVELLLFEATAKKDLISLKWITSSEKNNLGFEIERAAGSSQDFEKIGFVNGHGSTTELHAYSFDDNNVSFNKNYYYRLKQIDFNGNNDFSKIVSASLSKENFSFYIFADMVSGATNLVYYLDANSDVSFEIYNMMGQKVKTIFNKSQEKGNHVLTLTPDESVSSNGIYMIRMIANNQVQTKSTLLVK